MIKIQTLESLESQKRLRKKIFDPKCLKTAWEKTDSKLCWCEDLFPLILHHSFIRCFQYKVLTIVKKTSWWSVKKATKTIRALLHIEEDGWKREQRRNIVKLMTIAMKAMMKKKKLYSHRCEVQEIWKKTDSDALSPFSSFLTDFFPWNLKTTFFRLHFSRWWWLLIYYFYILTRRATNNEV